MAGYVSATSQTSKHNTYRPLYSSSDVESNTRRPEYPKSRRWDQWSVPLSSLSLAPNLKAPLDDVEKIRRDLGIHTRGHLELSTVARAVDPTPWANQPEKLISLARLTAFYLKVYLGKPAALRRSNWEQDLSAPMLECKLRKENHPNGV